MADPEHLQVLERGVAAWNAWRQQHPAIEPDLTGVDLQDRDLGGVFFAATRLAGARLAGANLHQARLTRADLTHADLSGCNLHRAILSGATGAGAQFVDTHLAEAALNGTVLDGANLDGCSLRRAQVTATHLRQATLRGARLQEVDFTMSSLPGADLSGASLRHSRLADVDLRGAILQDVDLEQASLVDVDLREAHIHRCRVFGLSAWRLVLDGAQQSQLVITTDEESPVLVDDLEVAQFIYLLIDNRKLRGVIDTLSTKAVLILGRFTETRLPVLEALRAPLRGRGLLPVIFNFERPPTRTLMETVTTLARLSRFIVADISDPASVPQELYGIVTTTPSVPVQPLLCEGQQPWSMYESIVPYPWVRALLSYRTPQEAAAVLQDVLPQLAPESPGPHTGAAGPWGTP
jgi:uncharacterized protein YjbI with pentapeptide repeats